MTAEADRTADDGTVDGSIYELARAFGRFAAELEHELKICGNDLVALLEIHALAEAGADRLKAIATDVASARIQYAAAAVARITEATR